MTRFVFHVSRDGVDGQLHYDNISSELLHQDGRPVVDVQRQHVSQGVALGISRHTPGKKAQIRVLKVSLGLSCNYACSYCSQRFVPHADSSSPSEVEGFVSMIQDSGIAPERIEFWGGEPLVYWKTLKPLAERLRDLFPEAQFGMVTNGSLLDSEKNEWIDRMGFGIGLSHDGPGYHVRGQDPLDDVEQRYAIEDLYRRLHPQGRISVNSMLHRSSQSRAAIQHWLRARFGSDVVIGEGVFIDPYDAGGLGEALRGDAEQATYRKTAFFELRSGMANNFEVAQRRVDEFIRSVQQGRDANSLGQKCGMDKEDAIAVDLQGNVVTCQNVSAAATAPNGQPHRTGHLLQLDSVEMRTSTHWSQRPSCTRCPVLQLCKGACMFLEGELWNTACETAYSDNVAFLATAIHQMTGATLKRIESEHLPERRQALWTAPKAKKVIPIQLTH